MSPSLKVAHALRRLHIAIAFPLGTWLIWQLSRGQHAGDESLAGLLARTSLRIASEKFGHFSRISGDDKSVRKHPTAQLK